MDETRWLDEREQRAWRGLLEMHARLTSRIGRQLQRDSGLSDSDYAVLVHLSEAPGPGLRLFELGERLGWEKSRLSHHIARMESRGLVRRRDCETDARGSFAALTRRGRAAVEAAAPLHVAEVRRLFVDALGARQLEALARASEAVLAHLDSLDVREGA